MQNHLAEPDYDPRRRAYLACCTMGATKAAWRLRTLRGASVVPTSISPRPRCRPHQFPQTANCGIYFPSMVELHMPKRPAPAIPANYNFAKAYSELKKLREDVECIERLSRSAFEPSDRSGWR